MICFYRWDVQDSFLNEIKRVGFNVKSQLVWNKVSHGMGDLEGEFGPQHELMIYATKGNYKFKGNRPKTVYTTPKITNGIVHPNEKPVNLLQAIIRDISSPGEIILDLFCGSESFPVACKIEGRKYIGFEISEKYFNIINKRLSTTKIGLI